MDGLWYFEPNGVDNIPDNILGQGVIVNVLDTCVDFYHNPTLSECHFPSKDDKACEVYFSKHPSTDKNFAEYVHGTAMASLICAKEGEHEFNPDANADYYKSKGIDKVHVRGMAPHSKVKAVEGKVSYTSISKLGDTIRDVKTSSGTPIFPNFKQSEIDLINLSGGSKESYGWVKEFKEICNDEYVLFFASAGNDGRNLNEKSNSASKIFPAAFKKEKLPANCTIVSVGALATYSSMDIPELYGNSNYGDKYVDLAAPGANIATLTPNNFGGIFSGTSESAAIASGLAALLSSCDPNANAKEIRGAIFEGSKNYESLKGKIKEGRVMDAYSSVQKFCFHSDDNFEAKDNDKYIYSTILKGSVALSLALISATSLYFCNFRGR